MPTWPDARHHRFALRLFFLSLSLSLSLSQGLLLPAITRRPRTDWSTRDRADLTILARLLCVLAYSRGSLAGKRPTGLAAPWPAPMETDANGTRRATRCRTGLVDPLPVRQYGPWVTNDCLT
jgi:hypothetical protein